MFQQVAHEWLFGQFRLRRGVAVKRSARIDSYLRPLRFETLEERRLLSITVNTLIDENDGINVGGISLREAIAAAVPGDTINFAPSLTANGAATIMLSHHELSNNGELLINKSLTIIGPGANLLTIDASGNDPTPDQNNGDGSRVFRIDDGNGFTRSVVQISGLQLTGGDVGTGVSTSSLEDESGGAILSREDLTLQSVSICGNSTERWGGAIESTGSFNVGGANLTITNSVISGNSGNATKGAINSYGPLVITNSQISDNIGGGIDESNNGGALIQIADTTISGNTNGSGLYVLAFGSTVTATVTRCTIEGNDSPSLGGGLYLNCTGNAVVTDNVIRDNHNTSNGGGVSISVGDSYPYVGAADIRRNLIEDNSSEADGGGARLIAGGTGVLTFADNVVQDNAANSGGGVLLQGSTGGTVEFINSTVSGNSTSGFGGGVFVENAFSSNLAIDDSTITANTSDSPASGSGVGGGIFVQQGLVHIRNSIIAANTDNTKLAPDISTLFGTIDLHYSLIGTNTGSGLISAPVGAADSNGNLIGSGSGAGVINPRLAPLAFNGGTMPTHALLSGSPAIDAGDPSFALSLPNDQRGAPFLRKFGTRVDMGAYERQTLPDTNYIVDTSSDEYDGDFSVGHLSLREAVGLANGNVASAQTIQFASTLGGQTILLTHGEIDITDSLTIIGPGANLLTIDASGNDPTPQVNNGDGSRIFYIYNGDSNSRSVVKIEGLTLTGGDTSGVGGAIATGEELTLQHVAIIGNSATGGGGVWSTPK